MPESPQRWYERVRAAIETDGCRDTELQRWSSWPWTGELTAKELEAPVETEPERHGAGGEGCRSCGTGQDPEAGGAVWWDEHFSLVPAESSSLPFAVFLVPRRHADLNDLTPQESPAEEFRADQLLVAQELAARAGGSVGLDPARDALVSRRPLHRSGGPARERGPAVRELAS